MLDLVVHYLPQNALRKYWPKIFATHPVLFLLLNGIKVVIFNEVLSEVNLVEERSCRA